ncbi:holo-[acyl-carrier-protein] synthase [Paenibacillus zeisoli]|uniref:Holo-[acyl-carrier-protein] synthase n=1 Tax=Paenibacillus zeisoli TaxID=2496267 RepID=A0A3S1D907_9BACL|nr:holo-ACP synthase [Paenibacillus zeisoli]RUT31544.1 holo-[acyl-carrier-protein] synthase [Paenibacillus zeisoli]
MIHGIGHDVVEIERIKRLTGSMHGERFVNRVLTAEERGLAVGHSRAAEFTAGRFAAKEAVSKAFGCGIGAVLGFQDIEIIPDASGKPWAKLTREAWERLAIADPEIYSIHVSITHERQLASAFVIVERA